MNGRMLLFGAVITALAATFAVYGMDSITVRASNGPEKCCMPEQWSAYMTYLKTINNEVYTVVELAMDYDRKMQAMLNYTGSKTPLNKVVIDYGKHMLYAVQLNYTKYCYKAPLTLPLIRCIPEDAEFLGDSYLGPMGAGQLPYNGWRFTAQPMVITMAFSQNGCVPILEGVSFPGNPDQDQVYLFSGYQPKLTDPSVFDLPDSCK